MKRYSINFNYAQVVATLVLCVISNIPIKAQAETNVYFTSITRSNSTINMVISAPPSEPIIVDWSADLAEWDPYFYFIDDNGLTGRVVFVSSSEGFVNISAPTSSTESPCFFRATLMDFPDEWPITIVPLKKEISTAEQAGPPYAPQAARR
jgi:hypothetical protein